jgi:hypothetical protein
MFKFFGVISLGMYKKNIDPYYGKTLPKKRSYLKNQKKRLPKWTALSIQN